jgi:RNA polymerase sigma-70 factor (ECF subfamily)
MDDDLDLLDRWCGGDGGSGNTLFHRHFAAVHAFFGNKVDRAADVDELVQDTFLECTRSRDRFRRQSSFRTYLFAIARFVLMAYWRRKRRSDEAIDFDEISVAGLSTSAGTRLARAEARQRLLAALRELPVEQQVLLELRYWEELEAEQLAEVFEFEPATTRSRLHRARQALRERLDEPAGRALGDDDLDAWARSLRAPAQNIRNAGGPADTTGA